MKTAILISTYNWKEALGLVLDSLMQQSVMPDEILIADDGSGEDTKELISSYSEKCKIPIRHFWQEDNGFRKSMILNKAVAGTSADYIIQTDGDCILHPEFVKDHIKSAKANIYLYGSRVNIKPEAVGRVLSNKIIYFNIFSKEIGNKTRSLHIPFLSKMYQPHEGISKKFRGCNFSFWRKDFIEVNGYNEDFEGWGREDSDLAIRLGNMGIKAKRLRYVGIVYHIHHNAKSKANLERNDEIQKETISKKITTVKNGVSKYMIG